MYEFSIDLHWRRSEPELRSGKFSDTHTVRYNESDQEQADALPRLGHY